MSVSAIYEGTIRHRRFSAGEHQFTHHIALMYLDLQELGGLLDGRLVRGRAGVVRFRRGDYLGDPSIPLVDAVRAQVKRDLGTAPTGPVRLLTQLRTFGHCFNPVSFYYCFAARQQRLDAVVAEVTNTPWRERHSYVVGRAQDGATLTGDLAKALHVSPFMKMEQHYTIRLREPGETLSVHIESKERGRLAFDATLSLRRRPLTHRNLTRINMRYPAATVRTLALIYGHALALKLKGVPVQPRPQEAA